MAVVTPNTLAPTVAVSVENTPHKTEAAVLPRKHLIIATGDPLKTEYIDKEIQVLSPEDVAVKSGYGYMAHRLAIQAFAGSNGSPPVYLLLQTETGAQATGSIVFNAVSVEAGTIHLYVAGLHVPFTVNAGDDGDAIATACVAALDGLALEFGLHTTQAVDGVTANQVNFTAKSTGDHWGNSVSLTFNWKSDQQFPVGLTSTVITEMSGGTGTPSIQSALDIIGTGDGQNEAHYTDVTHGYGPESSTLDALSIYNGIGDTTTGNYGDTVGRPFRSLNGDVGAGSPGFTAATAITDGRKLDRTSGLWAVPGSPNHPAEIAALVSGIHANLNNSSAQAWPQDEVLPGIIPGAKEDRWTSDLVNRDNAIKKGLGVSQVKNGAVSIQYVCSFYHPAEIPQSTNGYREWRDLSITQNVIDAFRAAFDIQFWKGITIVEDKLEVTDFAAKQKARDIGDVTATTIDLIESMASLGWLYNSSFTVDRIAEGGKITLRSGNTGFDIQPDLIYSGSAGIVNVLAKLDKSIAVLS